MYTVPVHPDQLRSITDPSDPEIRTLYALVNVMDIPKGLSLSPDPRVPKVNRVTRRIVESLKQWDGRFHILNRGLVISAQSAEYDNANRVLRLDIPDDEDYGILDGGHTQFSIERALQDPRPSDEDYLAQYVRIEVLLGVKDFLGSIASARNFSENVKAISLAHYEKKLDWLKKAVEDYAKHVRWSENDPGKMDAQELIQILTAMNPTLYNATDQPIEAYKNSGLCLEYITDDDDRHGYKHLAPIVVDIWRLYDIIRSRWWKLYQLPDPNTKRRGRPRSLQEVKDRKRGHRRLMRYVTLGKDGDPDKGDVHVEKGLAFPVLAGFRYLLVEGEDGNHEWVEDPEAFFARHGQVLIRRIMELSGQRQSNPHIVGRDPNVYQQMYEQVELLRFREEKEETKPKAKRRAVRRRTAT